MDTVNVSDMQKNWDDARGRAATNYPLGINKNTSWYDKALSGQNTYVQAMQNPSILNRRMTGLQSKTNQNSWKAASVAKGSARISAGMLAGKPKYDAAAQTIISTLQSVSLPDRTADPDQNIDNRVKPIAHALRRAFNKE